MLNLSQLGQMGNGCRSLICIKQRSANYRLWIQYGPLPAFVKKCFLGTQPLLCIMYPLMVVSHYNGRVGYVQRPCSLQNLKCSPSLYLLPTSAAPGIKFYLRLSSCLVQLKTVFRQLPTLHPGAQRWVSKQHPLTTNSSLIRLFCHNSENPMWRLR